MIDPQTATDEEVSAWLAEHCLELRIKDGKWYNKGECLPVLAPVKPTSDYEQLVMCEAKVRGRWIIFSQLWPNEKYYADGECYPTGSQDHRIERTVEASSELSARARLVVAILQWEAGDDTQGMDR